MALIVVEPASMPSQQGPFASAIFPLGAWKRAWRSVKRRYSSSSAKRGSMVLDDPRSTSVFFRTSESPRSRSSGQSCMAETAAPMATYSSPCSGMIISSSAMDRVSWKRSRRAGMKVRGPPRKATFPRIGRPQARPEIVWLTTDWKTEAAISSWVAPSFKRVWISVLAKTPQREAMG